MNNLCSEFRVSLVPGGRLTMSAPEPSSLTVRAAKGSVLTTSAVDRSVLSVTAVDRSALRMTYVCSVDFQRYLRISPTVLWVMPNLHVDNSVESNARWTIE